MTKSARPAWPILAIAIGLSGVAISHPAAAQSVLVSPDDVAACLCRDQAVSSQKAELTRQQAAYDSAQSEFQRLNTAVETQRPQVNVNDSGSIEAFRKLLDQRDAAQARFTNEASPAYAAAVDRYNQSVQAYMNQCGGKSYDSRALAAAQQSLSCPR